jgi:uncharacterized repeat protein (TIGR01451 family)
MSATLPLPTTCQVPSLAEPTQPIADLGVVKHVDRATAQVGQRLTYTLRVTNHGPDDAANVQLSDTWTLGLKVISAHASQGSCGGAPLQCSLGKMKSGAGATITVVAIVKHPGREKNTAVVASDSRDPDQGNNDSTAESVIEQPRRPPPPPVVTG